MEQSVRSVLIGTSPLTLLLVLAAILTALRAPPRPDAVARAATLRWFLLGIAMQCVHAVEEFVTGFHVRLPELLGQTPWSAEFFVAFNLTWIAIWILAALTLSSTSRLPLIPIWFFALAMMANGVAHPLLALATGGYFPGLASSPVVGVLGIALTRRLLALTRS